jgi:hypothetical protein
LRMSQRESEAGSAFVPLAAASSAESSGIVMSAFSAMRASRNAHADQAWRGGVRRSAWGRDLLGEVNHTRRLKGILIESN